MAKIKLVTPGSAIRNASVARHVTDCTTRPGIFCYFPMEYPGSGLVLSYLITFMPCMHNDLENSTHDNSLNSKFGNCMYILILSICLKEKGKMELVGIIADRI